MTITNTKRAVREKAGKIQGWSGSPEREGWEVKLGYRSPLPFCMGAPSCLLLFLHRLAHSAGSWLQGWPEVQVSFLPSTMNKSSGSGGIVRLGKAGRWVNQKPHPLFSGAADIPAGLQAQGLCSCVMYTGIQVPLRAYQDGYPVPITFSLPVKMTLHPEGASGDPLSASPIKSSTAVWQHSLYLTGESHLGLPESPLGQFPELLHFIYLQISSPEFFEGLMPNAFWRNWKKWITAGNAVRHFDG